MTTYYALECPAMLRKGMCLRLRLIVEPSPPALRRVVTMVSPCLGHKAFVRGAELECDERGIPQRIVAIVLLDGTRRDL